MIVRKYDGNIVSVIAYCMSSLIVFADVTISSDFISGFCSETEEEHKDTVSLLEEVKYDQAFMVSHHIICV